MSNPATANPSTSSDSVPSPGLEPTPPPINRPRAGVWGQLNSLVRYLLQTEVHTYAFSVAANAILSLFPFIVVTWTIERRFFHSERMEQALIDMLRYFLPAHQDFVVRNMGLLAHVRGKVQVISIVTLLISSTGVFLPLEVALNRVWGLDENRSYVRNQVVSLILAFGVGLLALFFIGFTAAQQHYLDIYFASRAKSATLGVLAYVAMRISAAIFSIGIFFLVYWVLPNRKLPVMAVLPTAIIAGLLWEGAKTVYVVVLPWLNLDAAYGPFSVSVGLMIWAYLTGLILLAGAQFSANRHTLRLAREAELEEQRNQLNST